MMKKAYICLMLWFLLQFYFHHVTRVIAAESAEDYLHVHNFITRERGYQLAQKFDCQEKTAQYTHPNGLKKTQIMKNKKNYKENKEKIVQLIANYTKQSPNQIRQYLQHDVDLDFLIAAAAISKTAKTEISHIILLKQQGNSFYQIIKLVKTNEIAVLKEMENIKHKIKRLN